MIVETIISLSIGALLAVSIGKLHEFQAEARIPTIAVGLQVRRTELDNGRTNAGHAGQDNVQGKCSYSKKFLVSGNGKEADRPLELRNAKIYIVIRNGSNRFILRPRCVHTYYIYTVASSKCTALAPRLHCLHAYKRGERRSAVGHIKRVEPHMFERLSALSK